MRLWVDALRSDTDGQCIGELVDMRGKHCAVGVGIVASGATTSPTVPQARQIYEFAAWLDCEPCDLNVRIGDVRRGVMELNDGLHLPFDDIADALEAEFLTPQASSS